MAENEPSKLSTTISDFLEFLRNCQSEYNLAQSDKEQYDSETQDILHEIELIDHICVDERDFIYARLRESRKQRRKAKDTIEELLPIISLMNTHSDIYNHLEQLLGAVRKVEKKHEGRFYVPRTQVLKGLEEVLDC